MRIVLLAGCLVGLAGLALGASLRPMANVTPVPVSAPGIGVPGAPIPAFVQPNPVPAAPAKKSESVSILKGTGDAKDPAPPVVPAPVFATPPPAPSHNDIAPRADPVKSECVIKPQNSRRDRTPIVWCPPLPAVSRDQQSEND
jgi:hypothetical protein